MIEPSSTNLLMDFEASSNNRLVIDFEPNFTSFNKEHSPCICLPQNSSAGREALRAFLLQGSIDSSQLKHELEKNAVPSLSKCKTNASRVVNFNLSANITRLLPTSHSRKSNWYSKSDYITFTQDIKKQVQQSRNNDHLFYHLHKPSTFDVHPTTLLSSSKDSLLRIYAESLLKKGGSKIGANSSGNATVRTLLEEGWDESDLSLRGLESYVIPDIKMYRKHYRKCLIQYYNKVLCKNGKRHCCNNEALRSFSTKMTEASINFSYFLGRIDAANTRNHGVSSCSCVHDMRGPCLSD